MNFLRKLTKKFELDEDFKDISDKSSFEDLSHLAMRRKRLESVKVPKSRGGLDDSQYVEERVSDSTPKGVNNVSYHNQETFSNEEIVRRNTTINSRKSRQVPQVDPKNEGSSGGSKINISQINVFHPVITQARDPH